jgi:SAM-dependent methyltransferase
MAARDHLGSVLEIAEAIAPGWERRRARIEDTVAPVREWLIAELARQPGETVLELAAGAGDTGFEASLLVGEDGRLITTDFSPAMLDVARRRGDELGVENVEYRLIDALHIDLDADSVDAVLCRFGYMLMDDPARALAQTRRVLRRGGRVALAVWGPPERNPFFAVVMRALVDRGHLDRPDPTPPGIFSLGNPDRLRAALEASGFTIIRTAPVPVRFHARDVDDYLSFTADTAGPIGLALRELSDADRDDIAKIVECEFEPFSTHGGYEVPGLAIVAVAR